MGERGGYRLKIIIPETKRESGAVYIVPPMEEEAYKSVLEAHTMRTHIGRLPIDSSVVMVRDTGDVLEEIGIPVVIRPH